MSRKKVNREQLPVRLATFAADLRVAMGFPTSVLEKSTTGFYLKIEGAGKSDGVESIALWHGLGDRQTPVIILASRVGKNRFAASTTIERPIQPMRDLLEKVFGAEIHADLTRDQALVVIYTMMLYLKVRG